MATSGLFSLVLLALSEKAACLTMAPGRVPTETAAPSRSRTVRLQQAPFVQGGLAVIANAEDTKLALSFFLEGEVTAAQSPLPSRSASRCVPTRLADYSRHHGGCIARRAPAAPPLSLLAPQCIRPTTHNLEPHM